MTDHLPFIRVSESPLVTELIDFPEIMQDRPGLQKVDIDPGIMLTHFATKFNKREGMFQQAAEIWMMHSLGCRSSLKFPRDLIVREDVFEQLPEIRIAVVADYLHQLGEHLFDIIPGGGEIMRQIDFMFETEAH